MTSSPLAVVTAGVVVAFAVSAGMTQWLLRTRLLLDRPNERSLHATPVPRTGGIAILAALGVAIGVSLILMPPAREWAWVALAVLVVAAVSLWDDHGEVRARYRLAAHLAAAGLLAAGGMEWTRLELPFLVWVMPAGPSLLLTLLLVVWMINLYNFMDGMDGLAGGMAVFGFGSLAVVGWQADAAAFALVNAAIAGAAGGFLTGNFPPAGIFLGDVGSAVLGLLAAASALVGSGEGVFPLWVAGLAFSPFIVDATWTLMRRLARGERLWEAHRSHHYQRLVLAGWSHRKTLLWSYLLMAACAATAVASTRMSDSDQRLLLGAWALIYLAIGLRVRLAERLAGPHST